MISRLPRAPNGNTGIHRRREQRGQRLRLRGQGASGARVARSATSSSTANRPWPPRTSPITGWRDCSLRSSANSCAPSAARALDQPLVLVGVERGDAGRAGQRMPAIREARLQSISCSSVAATSRESTTAPSGSAAPVSPFASVIRSGRPASPWRCQANHSPQRPKRAHDFVGDQPDTACRGRRREARASSCPARRCRWCRRSAPSSPRRPRRLPHGRCGRRRPPPRACRIPRLSCCRRDSGTHRAAAHGGRPALPARREPACGCRPDSAIAR